MDLTIVLEALNAYQEARTWSALADSELARVRENLAVARGVAEQRRADLLAAQGALIVALQGAGFVLAPAPRPAVTAPPAETSAAGALVPEGPVDTIRGESVQGRRNGRGEIVLAALRTAGAGGLTKGEVLAAVAEGPPGGWTAANVQSTLQRLALDGRVAAPVPYSKGAWRIVGAETGALEGAATEAPHVPMQFSLGRAALLAVGRLLARSFPAAVRLDCVQALPLPGFALSPTDRHRALGRALDKHILRGRAEAVGEGRYRALPAMGAWLPKEGA